MPSNPARRLATLLPTLLLAGCGALMPPSTEAPGRAARPPTPSPLAAESRWLRELFGATPVTIGDETDGSVRVGVPLVHAFAPDSAEPRPPLKAVLDRLALSLQRQGAARLQVDAPGPGASERREAMRRHLQAKGLAPWRVSAWPGAASEDRVALRLRPGPSAIGRLDDDALPRPPRRP